MSGHAALCPPRTFVLVGLAQLPYLPISLWLRPSMPTRHFHGLSTQPTGPQARKGA